MYISAFFEKKWISSFTLNLLTGSQLAINAVLKKEKSIFGLEYVHMQQLQKRLWSFNFHSEK